MEGKIRNFQSQSGLTLVELLVVVAIIALLASLALMQQGPANQQLRRQNVARELKVAFERARYDSVKRRADGTEPFAHVEITPTSFTLRTYPTNASGTTVANDQVFPFPDGIVAEGYGFSIGGSKQVQFNRRGEATVVGGGIPQFMICNGANCPAEPGDASTTNTVLVTPTGTVNLLVGGNPVPTFASANVSNPTVVIRDEVVLP